MKKLLGVMFAAMLIFVLTACGNDNTSTEEEGITSTGAPSGEEKTKTVSFEDAVVGDEVSDDYGTYTIIKSVTPDPSEFNSNPIVMTLDKVMLATFTPGENAPSSLGTEELNLAVAIIKSENTSDDTVSFHPYSASVTTDTKGQYKAQEYLNEDESEHIGKVIQDQRIAYNLEDEDLEAINKLTFTFDPPSVDARKVGEDLTVEVELNE